MPALAEKATPYADLEELMGALLEWQEYAEELQCLAEMQLELLLNEEFEGDLSPLMEEKERLYRAIQPFSDRVGVLLEECSQFHSDDPDWLQVRREIDRVRTELLGGVGVLMNLEARSEEAAKAQMARIQNELNRMDTRKNLTQTYGSRPAANGPCFLDHRR